jgi:intein-encoded DNA endonuclease-like protein
MENFKYKLDINNIIKWCLDNSLNPFKEVEINETYDSDDDGDIQIMAKSVRELKTINTQNDTFRYDFIKVILSPFLSGDVTSEDLNENFSYRLLFNTLVDMNFLVEITD